MGNAAQLLNVQTKRWRIFGGVKKLCGLFAAVRFRMPLNILCSFLCLMAISFEAVAASKVESVRLWRSPDSTRIVFDLSAPVIHELKTYSNPDRVVIDIKNTTLSTNFDDLELGNTPVQRIRYGKQEKTTLRVVLDMSGKVSPSSFILPKNQEKSDRLVVDLADVKAKLPVQKVQDIRELFSDKRDIIVAIDAGHGGEDPGALGPRKRIKEKEIVLKICKQLKEMIDAEPGYSAFLVRTGDYYVALGARRDKAREMRADLFVSVHADAFDKPEAHGASVYALSQRGASSESARFLAAKENRSDLIGGEHNLDISGMEKDVAQLIVDFAMTSTLSNSLDVGGYILEELGGIKGLHLHKKQVEQAGFMVLKSPDVPSVLVETGFISNPNEARKLNTYAHRRSLATAIFKGITRYFYTNPPTGSLVAWQKHHHGKERQYTISKGDTLSAIARRHNISLNDLLQHNGLQRSTIIRVGQTLVIPAS